MGVVASGLKGSYWFLSSCCLSSSFSCVSSSSWQLLCEHGKRRTGGKGFVFAETRKGGSLANGEQEDPMDFGVSHTYERCVESDTLAISQEGLHELKQHLRRGKWVTYSDRCTHLKI